MTDLIIPRGDVQPGDQLLREGSLVEVLKVIHFSRSWDSSEKTGEPLSRQFTELEYRVADDFYGPAGKVFAADAPSDQLVAVRRP